MKEIKAYQCGYCKKVSRTITGIKLHEKVCKANPEVNHCANCVHGIMEFQSEETEWGASHKWPAPYCDYHKMFIFHENKSDNAYFMECDYDYDWNDGEHPTPFTCFGFESKGKHGFEEIEEIIQEPNFY